MPQSLRIPITPHPVMADFKRLNITYAELAYIMGKGGRRISPCRLSEALRGLVPMSQELEEHVRNALREIADLLTPPPRGWGQRTTPKHSVSAGWPQKNPSVG